MLCKSFESLSHQEKVQFIGKLCHATQSSEHAFALAKDLIDFGERAGLFDNVKILPENGEEKIVQDNSISS